MGYLWVYGIITRNIDEWHKKPVLYLNLSNQQVSGIDYNITFLLFLKEIILKDGKIQIQII